MSLTFTLPFGCSSSVTDTLSCCRRLFTSLEQHTLMAPCTWEALNSENVLLSMTSSRPVPLWMRLARRLMSMALRLVGPFSPAMTSTLGVLFREGRRQKEEGLKKRRCCQRVSTGAGNGRSMVPEERQDKIININSNRITTLEYTARLGLQ